MPTPASMLARLSSGAAELAQRTWIADECDPTAIVGLAGARGPARMLARVLREQPELALVATPTLDPSALRVLREHGLALLVLTGAVEPELLDDLRGMTRLALLGPHASLWIGPRTHGERRCPIACAPDRDELRRLVDALGAARVALAPTPRWLPSVLDDEPLAEHDLVGYVPGDALVLGWLAWAEGRALARRALLIPLAVPPVDLERARHPNLEPALVAHALEQLGGPIYPAPQVLALLYAALLHEPIDERERGRWLAGQSERALALWQQARRALPHAGDSPGMHVPMAELELDVPPAAFLAQRTLLRIRRAERLLASERARPLELGPLDASGHERAMQVLAGASEVLSDHESKVVLRGFGLEVTRQAVANSPSGAATFADKIGYPVVLKALSPDLRRKGELGALELDVANAAAVKRSYARIVANVEERAPSVMLDGVVVAEQIGPGFDLHCGGLRLRSGGVALFAKPLHDAASEPVLAAAPLSPARALLLAEAALAHVPRRRAEDPDVRVLALVLLHLARLFEATGERLLQVDLGALRMLSGASERAYVTLDARIVQRPHLEGAL